MTHYDRYPMMMPYVGARYASPQMPSLLLIGESHYFPEDATSHLDAEKWYASDSGSLRPTDSDWINTSALMEESRADGFSNSSHTIWSNSFHEINQNGPHYDDYKRVADDIAFYNFFLRPGEEGESLDVKTLDVERANEAFEWHLTRLRPSAVIFLSRLARMHLDDRLTHEVPVIATPHPGCEWWNRVAGKYGNRRGRDILADFIKTLDWSHANPK